MESFRGESEYPIANEFARVTVRKVYTRNGERLEIHAPFYKALIHLDPLQLEALARNDWELSSALIFQQGPDNSEGDLLADL